MSDQCAEPGDAVKAAAEAEVYGLVELPDGGGCHECAEQALRPPRRSVFEAAELLQTAGWVLLILLVCGIGLWRELSP